MMRARRLRLRARRAMTLMELTVTLTITALVTAAGAAALTTIIDERRIISESNLPIERAAALRDMIRSWITAGTIQVSTSTITNNGTSTTTIRPITSATSPGGTGLTAAVATGDEVSFATNALTPGTGPSTRVRMFIDGDPNTVEEGLTIEYQARANSPLARKQLEPMIGGMIVEYFDNRTKQWFGASQVATIQPIAVRITFQSYDESNPAYALSPLLRVPFVFRMVNAQITRSTSSTTTGR
jgi:type II secretory pathway pseudopilin PulG